MAGTVTNMRCPKCGSPDPKITTNPGAGVRAVRAICNECGFQEADYTVGTTGNCRCPSCASTDVNIRTVSAQSGNTDWTVFSCNSCGLDSGIVDDQQYESDCEWYDPSNYSWLAEITKELQRSPPPTPKRQAVAHPPDTKERRPLSSWYFVKFDNTKAYRRVSPPGAASWEDSFEWADVIRVCYEPSGDFHTSDTFYIFVKERPESFAIPSEADGATALWGEIIRRGLFDAETSIKVSTGQLGISCWPPIDVG